MRGVGAFADLMNRPFRPTVAAMLTSKTHVLAMASATFFVSMGGLAGCGSTPQHAEMVSNAPNAGASPLIDREKCNDKDKHVVTADTDQDKKPDVWKFFKTVDMGGQKTEVVACKQVDLNHDGKIDMVTYFDDADRRSSWKRSTVTSTASSTSPPTTSRANGSATNST